MKKSSKLIFCGVYHVTVLVVNYPELSKVLNVKLRVGYFHLKYECFSNVVRVDFNKN